jgi:hypothetical protein
MLPMRSWDATFAGQANHFGEDLSLDAAAVRRLDAIAKRGVEGESWACWKTRMSIEPSQSPLKITASPYWLERHRSLDESRFKPPVSSGPHDCGACHRDAASSIFHPRFIRVPR